MGKFTRLQFITAGAGMAAIAGLGLAGCAPEGKGGAAMAATTPRELLDTLRHISEHPASADAMLINASLLRRPHAADAIAAATFDLIAKEPPRDGKLRSRHFLHFYWGRKPAHTR